MTRLQYTDQGSGSVVVLLHGFCESKEIWKGMSEGLSKEFRVICPDLPGFGGSILERESVSMEYFAETVKELMDHLAIKKFTLIGHSLGGYVTLAFAESYPSMLNGFGLFHSTSYEDAPERKEARNKTYEFIKKNGVESFVTTFVPPLFFMRNRKRLAQEIEAVIKMAAKSSEKGVLATILAMRDRKQRVSVLKESKVPVLFIIGKEDTSIPYDKIMEQILLPAQPIVQIMDETGHMGMFEKKEESLAVLKEFILNVSKEKTPFS
jgi:pimeloyl-ACP methyl ester carboxylesterase